MEFVLRHIEYGVSLATVLILNPIQYIPEKYKGTQPQKMYDVLLSSFAFDQFVPYENSPN